MKRKTITGGPIDLKLTQKRVAKVNAESERSVREIKNEPDMTESGASFAASHNVRARRSTKATSDEGNELYITENECH
jgi:hypothetical protein